ncbi:MAG TPA: PhzF family phenazine biosynthesis protein [Candidatus Binatia bacterium]|jgi:trans-2,3-dihydro-3-hydroxyanthranilate isomerase|nr:PhzF family phenazine biosynthesis protein [Candidatus Binatia bacterium]
MGKYRLFIVDVFAEEQYAGNQLAVVTLADSLSEPEMQRIAREMNFSETTFIISNDPRAGGYDVRIFTPATELPFAGHPTLGTAYVIRHELAPTPPEQLVLHLKIGPVPVTFESLPGGKETVWMQPPAPVLGTVRSAQAVAEMLGLTPDDIDPHFPVQEVSVGIPFLFVPLSSLTALKRARVDVDRRSTLLQQGISALHIFLFCRETYQPDHDLAARMFFEANGMREDPATGSANVCLGAYLLKHGYFAGDRIDIKVEQGYEIGRPSLLLVRAAWQSGEPRVSVGGHVIMTVRGELV